MDTKKLRQKILDLAIRGKLVPQDPNDEPASVLLERIRTEKERLIKEGKIKRSKKTATDDEIEAPNGWVCCRFDEICSKFSTGPFGSMVHKSDYVSKDGTPIVNPMNIVEGKISTNNLMMVSNEKAQELDRYRLTKDDILIARRGDLRKCCIVTEDSVNWLCGTGSFFLHAPFVEPRYIEFFYLSEYVQTILKRECVGATMDNLNQSVLGSIPFLLPPLSEQQRIVNEVERCFAVFDALENNEGDLLKAIDKAKSKILDLAIHGKLVPQDPNDESAIELLKRINPKFEPCDNVNDLPKKWIQATLGDIGKWKSGGTPDRKIKSYYNNGQIPWLKIADIQDGYVKTAEEFMTQEGLDNSSANINPVGSIALAMYGSIGKVGILTFPAATNQAICVCSDYVIEQKYLFYFLLSQRSGFYMMAGGGVQANISKQIIVKYPISIPPYNEQLRIVAKIKELFAVLNSIKKSLE